MSPENTPFTDSTPALDAEIRDRLADSVAATAVFDGWTETAIAAAARGLGLPEGEAGRLFPGGPLGVLEYLASRSDARMVADLEVLGVATMKVRERIWTAVRLRLEKHSGEREAARRALSLLAMPLNAGLALKILYRTVDAMWYAAGDQSVDFNFYTKRATLAGVYSTTVLDLLSLPSLPVTF